MRGSRLADDLELQEGVHVSCVASRGCHQLNCSHKFLEELLKGWERLGVSFSGAILQAEHKETVKEYAARHRSLNLVFERCSDDDSLVSQQRL